jgi:CRISPR-associated protein Csd1
MLEQLAQYSRAQGLAAQPGLKPKDVRWSLVFGRDGRFLEVLHLGEIVNGKHQGRLFSQCPDLTLGEIKSGGAGCRHFLVDSADVMALLSDEEPDSKLLAKHAYSLKLLRQASQAVPELALIAATMGDPEAAQAIRAALRAQKAKPMDRVTFSMLGAVPAHFVESEAWHDWWRSFRRELGGAEAGKPPAAHEDVETARCLVSGDAVVPILTHPKIGGLVDVGGLAMGDVIASFKQEAFCSYGLSQAENAPVSAQKASEYAAALNHLLREHSHRLAGAKVVHWFKKYVAPEDDPLSWLESPDTQAEADAQGRARKLLQAIQNGDSAAAYLAGNHYYAMTLSGASGRVMVREWIEGPFEELVQRVGQWFDDLAIVRRDGTSLAPSPKLWSVLASLVRDVKDLPPSLGAAVWRSAVRGERIPGHAHAQALLRFRADVLQNETFNHARVGLLKAYHLRLDRGQPMAPHLDEDHPTPAYQCGRLLALMAALQYRALGDVGAGVVQRFYAAASTTPALVLGRLTRTAQFHLDKLDRGLARWYEGRIADVWARIENHVPSTLSLDEQSLFALGYYQQIAHDRVRPRPDAPDAPTAVPDTTDSTAEEAPNV